MFFLLSSTYPPSVHLVVLNFGDLTISYMQEKIIKQAVDISREMSKTFDKYRPSDLS